MRLKKQLPSFWVVTVLGIVASSMLSTGSVRAATFGGGGELPFERLSRPEPPHRSVFALHQDSDGFLWIGTQDGLARFDGYEMKTFRHDPNDSRSLSNSSVRAILEDSLGQLWIGTENGLNRLDRHRLTVDRVVTPGRSEGNGAWFHCALRTRDGILWFGTDDGLLVHDPARDGFQWLRFQIDEPNGFDQPVVVALEQDLGGEVWALTSSPEGQSLKHLAPQGRVVEQIPLPGAGGRWHTMLMDSNGRFWTHPSAPLDLEAETDVAVAADGETVCSESRASLQRADGSVWIACDDGLYSLDTVSGVSDRHRIVNASGSWLENFGRALLEDRSGTLWVGTEGGLYRLDPNSKPFVVLQRNPARADSLSASAVSSVDAAPDGDLWVSTYGGGLNRVDPTTGAARRFCVDTVRNDRCTSDVIWHVRSSVDGTLWIAGSELWSIDPADDSMTLHSSAGVVDGYLTYIVEGDDGVLWLGGTRGQLYRYGIETGEFEVIVLGIEGQNPEAGSRIDSLLLEGSTLWVGLGNALGAYDTIDGTFEKTVLATPDGTNLTGLGSWFIHRDQAGRLWIGTSVGLVRHSSSDAVFHLLTTHDGLPGSAVYSVLEDDSGIMWMGTNQGLARFDPDLGEGRQFRKFTIADGIGNVEFNRHAAFACADGTMLFGGMDGLTGFHPDRIRNNTFVPPVHITDIEVGSRRGIQTVAPGGLRRLVLAPGDTTVSFRFAALSFSAPDLNRYAYRLEGFDMGWIEAGTRRTTQYTNLPPGKYRFRVKGSNNDGIWNEEGAALEVVVRPTLWQTWWLRPAVFLMVVGIALAALLYRNARKRELERLRMRIAGDLHDDLSSDLSGIAVLADLVRVADDLGPGERRDLGDIRDASLRMADGLRDIVWYIDPDHDSLQATVRRMKCVSSTLLRGTSCEFVANLPDRGVFLPVNTRRSVFLIFKEAVHNIARHAEASRVDIEIAVSGPSLTLRIIDDGRGFASTSDGDGHGLCSMQRRADEAGGRLEIDSSPGRGTEVRISVNIAGSRDGDVRRRRPMLVDGSDDTGRN